MAEMQSIIRLRSVLKETVRTISTENQPLMADILTKVVIETLDKFHKKLNVGVQDSISDLLDQFKRTIEREIFDVAQQWVLATREEKFLFPRNCRFVSSKGHSTIVVIEQEPGRRNITIDRGLLGHNPEGSKTRQTVRKSLWFPYVIFVLQWKGGRLVNAYTAWRKEPLTKLTDSVFNPVMPNTHENYAICTGDLVMPNGDISLGSERVISDYWQSVFNNDLSGFWWEKHDYDGMGTVEEWEENSGDPFLFNGVTLKSKYKTLENMIDFCIDNEQDPDSTELRRRLTEKIETCSEQMFVKVMKYFKKVKFDRFYPKEVEEQLARSMESVINEICDLVLVMQNEVNSLSSEVSRNRKDVDHYGWESRSPNWTT